MSNDCLMKIARTTIKDKDVIFQLSTVGTSFCTLLNDDIITQEMRQKILGTKSNLDGLGYIRDVSDISFIFNS